MAKGQDKYLIDAPPDHKDPSYATCKLEDAHIRLCLWISVEPQISNSLRYYTSAKQAWDQAKMFSGVGNLWRT